MMQTNLNHEFRRGRRAGSLSVGLLSALTLVFCCTLAAAQSAPQAAPQADTAQYDYASQTLRVGVWVDRNEDEVYRRGDEMEVSLQTNADAYVVVYRIDAEGLVSILWPRTRMDDGFVFGGHEYQLPVTGGPRLRVAAEEGLGYVEAVASAYPFDLRDLEIDFHHERTDRRYDFYVAGDPFLAMNEVNFAVTGLEDAADYVVTNYASYYVHEKVDHPRYLCNQCHVDNDVTYDPYVDHCTLEITYDYGWSNRWYIDYGYYPVYWHPIYVYYDPWTWRPWVNYWYRPFYRYPYYPSYHWGYSACYWYDSPYYWGDVYHYRDLGRGIYRPVGHVYDGDPRTKYREYGPTSPLVKGTLTDSERVAMKDRSPIAGRKTRDGIAIAGGKDRVAISSLGGERPLIRTRQDLNLRETTTTRTRPGLQIRDNSRPTIRHTAGGSTTRPGIAPVRGKEAPLRGGGVTTIGGARSPGTSTGVRPTPQRGGDIGKERGGSKGTITPVEPRKKGTRVWNRGTYESNNNGSSRPGGKTTVRDSRSSGSSSGSSRDSKVRDSGSSGTKRTGDSGSTIRRSTPKSTPKVKSSRGSSGSTRSSSSNRSSTPTVKSSRSSGSSKSTGSRSSSGSSGGSRSRSSGGSSGSSKRR